MMINLADYRTSEKFLNKEWGDIIKYGTPEKKIGTSTVSMRNKLHKIVTEKLSIHTGVENEEELRKIIPMYCNIALQNSMSTKWGFKRIKKEVIPAIHSEKESVSIKLINHNIG